MVGRARVRRRTDPAYESIGLRRLAGLMIGSLSQAVTFSVPTWRHNHWRKRGPLAIQNIQYGIPQSAREANRDIRRNRAGAAGRTAQGIRLSDGFYQRQHVFRHFRGEHVSAPAERPATEDDR